MHRFHYHFFCNKRPVRNLLTNQSTADFEETEALLSLLRYVLQNFYFSVNTVYGRGNITGLTIALGAANQQAFQRLTPSPS